MTEASTADHPGLVAEDPEYCHNCYRLSLPWQRYFLIIEKALVCPDCVRAVDAIRLSGGMTVRIEEDRLPVRVRWCPSCSLTARGSELHLSSVAA
jgi:hypothetical protein